MSLHETSCVCVCVRQLGVKQRKWISPVMSGKGYIKSQFESCLIVAEMFDDFSFQSFGHKWSGTEFMSCTLLFKHLCGKICGLIEWKKKGKTERKGIAEMTSIRDGGKWRLSAVSCDYEIPCKKCIPPPRKRDNSFSLSLWVYSTNWMVSWKSCWK